MRAKKWWKLMSRGTCLILIFRLTPLTSVMCWLSLQMAQRMALFNFENSLMLAYCMLQQLCCCYERQTYYVKWCSGTYSVNQGWGSSDPGVICDLPELSVWCLDLSPGHTHFPAIVLLLRSCLSLAWLCILLECFLLFEMCPWSLILTFGCLCEGQRKRVSL